MTRSDNTAISVWACERVVDQNLFVEALLGVSVSVIGLEVA